jgi:putative intracellular protease/amidase
MATIAFPLPDTDFDVTECAVPWKILTRAGHRVVFSTETGTMPACDPLLIDGVLRGTDEDDRAAFVVEDGRYLSARWPGDAYL